MPMISDYYQVASEAHALTDVLTDKPVGGFLKSRDNSWAFNNVSINKRELALKRSVTGFSPLSPLT